MSRLSTVLALAVLPFCLGSAIAASVGAQQVDTPGYSTPTAGAERMLEQQVIATPSAVQARAHSRALSAAAHVAGTPGQVRTRDYVVAQMKAMGLETEVRRYDVFMPHPTSVQVWRVSPRPKAFSLAEPPIPGDPTSATPQYLTVNGYSGAGDASGEIVYVNY